MTVDELKAAKAQAKIGIDQFHAETLKTLTGGATVEERDTWPSKEAAARAFMCNKADKTQMEMLGIEAKFTGEDIMTLSENVIAKSERFRRLIGLASGLRRKAVAGLEQCQTAEHIQQLMGSLETEAKRLITQYAG